MRCRFHRIGKVNGCVALSLPATILPSPHGKFECIGAPSMQKQRLISLHEFCRPRKANPEKV